MATDDLDIMNQVILKLIKLRLTDAEIKSTFQTSLRDMREAWTNGEEKVHERAER
jgi:hypothetical protein